MEKDEVLKELFALVFTASQASQISRFPELEDEGWGSDVPPTVSKEHVQGLLMKLVQGTCRA